MSYQILAADDQTYERTIAYVHEHCPNELRVESRRRRMLGVDDLSDEAVRELEAIGAAVVEDFEYAMETTARRW
jgi:hypothetical protein